MAAEGLDHIWRINEELRSYKGKDDLLQVSFHAYIVFLPPLCIGFFKPTQVFVLFCAAVRGSLFSYSTCILSVNPGH